MLTLILQGHIETFIRSTAVKSCFLLICPSLTHRFHLIAVAKHLVLLNTRQDIQLIIPLEPSAGAALSGATV